jgi:hypothetical protein
VADAAHGVDEALAAGALRLEGVEHGLHGVGDLVGGERRADHLAGLRGAGEPAAVAAAQGELVPLAAVLVDAQHADVAAVVVAAGVDAAADVQVDVADVVELVEVLEALGDLGGQRQRAGVGQRAEVAAGAGDHVGQQADVGGGETGGAGGLPQSSAARPRCTQGSSRFWSCVTRSSPWLKRSASVRRPPSARPSRRRAAGRRA